MDQPQPDDVQDGSLESRESYASLLYWKIKLDEILRGERASEIIQSRGSAADYVKTLFPAAQRTTARFYLVTGLDETLKEVSLTSLSPSALNHILDLIVEFLPNNGFAAIVDYLRMGGLADADFLPVGAAIRIDLHQKTLETLSGYYDAPALNARDPAFRTYVAILRQQAHVGYAGYAASELLKLEVLQPDSREFKQLLERNPESLTEIFADLSYYASNGYGIGMLQTLFLVCLELGRDVSNTLVDAIKSAGAILEPTVQPHPNYPSQLIETPTCILRLADGTAIPLNLTAEQLEMVEKDQHLNDTRSDVRRLLFEYTDELQPEFATALFAKSCFFGIPGVRVFRQEIEKHGGDLIFDPDANRIYIEFDEDSIDIDLPRINHAHYETYIDYLKSINDIPDEPAEIDKTIEESLKATEAAFAAG